MASGSEIKVKKYQTVDDAYNAGHFYAINTSDGGKKRPIGNVVIGVRTNDGRTTQIMLPPTWIPIDLRMFAQPEDLRASPSLRQSLRTGAFILVSEETANEMRNHPAYANEEKRVREKMNSFNASSQASGVTEATISVSKSEGIFGNVENAAGNTAFVATQTPLTDMILNAGTDEELIRAFNTNLRGLSPGELDYIRQNATVGSITQLIAMELSDALINGGVVINRVEETNAFKEAAQRGVALGPSFSFT